MSFDFFHDTNVKLKDGSLRPTRFGFWRGQLNDAILTSEKSSRAAFRAHVMKHFVCPDEPWDAVFRVGPFNGAVDSFCDAYRKVTGFRDLTDIQCRRALSRLWQEDLTPDHRNTHEAFCQTALYQGVEVWERAYDAIAPVLAQLTVNPAQLPRYAVQGSLLKLNEKHYLTKAGFVLITNVHPQCEQVVTAYFPHHEKNWRSTFERPCRQNNYAPLYDYFYKRACNVYGYRCKARSLELVVPENWA